jgi:hypothetical protein
LRSTIDLVMVDAQFILLSGSASVSSGVLRFFSQAGQPLALPLR